MSLIFGVAIKSVECGTLRALGRFVDRREAFTEGASEEVKTVFETLGRVREEWNVVENEHGGGAMINLDHRDVQAYLMHGTLFPPETERIANARRLREVKDAEWFRQAYSLPASLQAAKARYRTLEIARVA